MSHKVVKITCACRAKHCDVCSKCSRWNFSGMDPLFWVCQKAKIWSPCLMEPLLILFRQLMKVLYIYTCKAMGLKLSCQRMWVPRDCAILFADRRVIGSQRLGGFFVCLCFFVGMTFHTKYKSITRSLFATAITK